LCSTRRGDAGAIDDAARCPTAAAAGAILLAMADLTVDTTTRDLDEAPADARGEGLALALLWSRGEPHRVGEIAWVPRGASVLGRGDAEAGALRFLRAGPDGAGRATPLAAPTLSRRQLELEGDGERVRVRNVGRRGLRHQGWPATACAAAPGDLLEVEEELLLRVERRPRGGPPVDAPHPFGRADAFGLVGETPAAWELRRQVRFAARRDAHVLLLGPSGSGKEIVARAIHEVSDRGRRRLASRNASTFPEALLDAELFGHAKDYPNAGMPERGGLVGEADGSTLFLDEIGEMPHALQAHLLRLLDSGEYSRLGDPRPRRVDVRVIAATNRPAEALKHDLRARLPLTLRVPGLDERRADVPLLAAHLVRRIAARDPEIGERFLDEHGGARLSLRLVAALVQHPYSTHVRELEGLLWDTMLHAAGRVLDESDAVRFSPGGDPEGPDPADVSREVLEAAMARHDGVRERVWRDLGLSSRHQLARLLKRHGMAP
jgi:two-component system nitrogen regulation response regulator GlnG/two-component system response regulator HydG